MSSSSRGHVVSMGFSYIVFTEILFKGDTPQTLGNTGLFSAFATALVAKGIRPGAHSALWLYHKTDVSFRCTQEEPQAANPSVRPQNAPRIVFATFSV